MGTSKNLAALIGNTWRSSGSAFLELAALVFAIQSSAARETKIRSKNHHYHDLLAANVAVTKSIHYGVWSEPSIKGWLLCGFMCQGMLHRPCRCCLWGLLGELNRFVCKPKGAEGSWGFTMAGLGLVEILLLLYFILCFWISCFMYGNELMFTLFDVHPILLLFDLQITYLIWLVPTQWLLFVRIHWLSIGSSGIKEGAIYLCDVSMIVDSYVAILLFVLRMMVEAITNHP
jgi:hypothetical protein